MSKRIAVIGSGYVGTVVAACFAHVGHRVLGVETDARKLAQLRAGKAPFHEPGLDPLLATTCRNGDLTFTGDLPGALRASDIVFVCVGTPPSPDGPPNLSDLAAVAAVIADNLDRHHVIVTKSTVPVGTGRWLTSLIEDRTNGSALAGERFSIVSNPEFLREGNAVQDFLHPDRVVVGSDDADTAPARRRGLSAHPRTGDPGRRRPSRPVPLVLTGLATAEMTKYASNSFLAHGSELRQRDRTPVRVRRRRRHRGTGGDRSRRAHRRSLPRRRRRLGRVVPRQGPGSAGQHRERVRLPPAPARRRPGGQRGTAPVRRRRAAPPPEDAPWRTGLCPRARLQGSDRRPTGLTGARHRDAVGPARRVRHRLRPDGRSGA